MTCWSFDQMVWDAMTDKTYPGRCYFYPDRDCPGWEAGGTCGRMGHQIPHDAGRIAKRDSDAEP